MHWTDEELGAYVDGELTRDEAAAARAHVAECAACRDTVAMLERVNEAVRDAAIEPSPGFEDRTLAKLRALSMPRRSWLGVLGFEGRRFVPAMAAASLVGVVAIGYQTWMTPAPTPFDEVDVAEQADFLEDLELIEDLEVLESMDKVPG